MSKVAHTFAYDPVASSFLHTVQKTNSVIRQRVALGLGVTNNQWNSGTSLQYFNFLWNECDIEGIYLRRVNDWFAIKGVPICTEQELLEAPMSIMEISAHGCSITQA